MDDMVSVRRSDLWVAFRLATGDRPVPDGLTPFALERLAAALGNCQPAALEHVGPGLDAWETFWALYPRRTAKKAARKAWDRAIKDEDPRAIVAGARAFAEHWKGQPRERLAYIPYPATWLNAGSWADELVPHAGTVSKVDKTRGNLVAAARAIESGPTFQERMAQAQQIELDA